MLRELIVLIGSGLIAWKVSEYVCIKYMQKFLDKTKKYNEEVAKIVVKEFNKSLNELKKIKTEDKTGWVTSVDIDDDLLEEE